MLPALIAAVISSPVVANTNATRTSISIVQSEVNSKERFSKLTTQTSRELTKVRSGLVAYYLSNMNWPSALNNIKTDNRYNGSFKTPYGSITGRPSGLGYQLIITLPTNDKQSRRIAQLIAAKSSGENNNNSVTVFVGVPTAASLVSGLLSRKYDPRNPDANKMSANLDMNNNNINNINVVNTNALNAQTVTSNSLNVTGNTNLGGMLNVSGLATINSLTARGNATFGNNVTINGATTTESLLVKKTLVAQGPVSLHNKLTVNGTTEFKDLVSFKKGLVVDGTTTVNGNLNLSKGRTLTADKIATKNLAINGTASIKNAIIDTLKVNKSLNFSGEIKQGRNIVVSRTGELYEQGIRLSNRYARLDQATTFQKDVTFNDNTTFKKLATFDRLTTNYLTTNSLEIILNNQWVNVASKLASYNTELNNQRTDINSLRSNYSSLNQKVTTESNNIKTVTNTINQYNSRITTADSNAKRALSIANQSFSTAQQAKTTSTNNANSIVNINSRVASLQRFEQDCRAKRGVCY
ncbi:hypothetical protein [Photobacterium kishitanii]|uniref:hypothetical protein n=1 Tax=Photobacterium kishitanii TaxID=318456 RepID=UPI0011B21C50|nr:hypothetical protein [Photobacterium kishitanii]